MIYAFDINKLDVVCKNAKRIILTDSVEYHTAKFKFSDDWEHLIKTAYFINKSNDKDEEDINVPMFLGNDETICLIPWEVLTREGQLVVSIQGVQDDTEIWTKMNRPIVLQKSDKDSNTMPEEPTIPIYNQLLNKLDSKGDNIQFEDDTLSLKSGDKVLSTTKIKDETKDYESLKNIPKLNDIEIKGDKTANDYKIGKDLKVDEAKVTYKGEEISFKDFITQYLKDNENITKLVEELSKNKAKKFDVNSPLSKEIGEGENADILKLKDKSIDKQFLAQSIVDILENIENIDFADYSEYSTKDNFYDLSQLDENKTIFVNKAGYVGIANSILYDWQAEEPTEKQNNVVYANSGSFITVNKGDNGYRLIYFIADENQYYFEKLTSDDDWKLYRTNLNAPYQAWQFAEQLDKTKQSTLVSGENIKTINNESILGSGNFELPKSPIEWHINDVNINEAGWYYYTKDTKSNATIILYNDDGSRASYPCFRQDKYTIACRMEKFEEDSHDVSTDNLIGVSILFLNSVDEETWNSERGIGVCYYKKVNGTWTKDEDVSGNLGMLKYTMSQFSTALIEAVTSETNRIVTTGKVDEQTGITTLNASGIGNGLKLENQELSVNTEGLDVNNSNVIYNENVVTLKEFADSVKESFDNIESEKVATILKPTNTEPYIEVSVADRYDIATSGTILIKEPTTSQAQELYVQKGEILFVSTYGTSDTETLHHIDYIRIYAGNGVNNLGIDYHKIAYNDNGEIKVNIKREVTHSVDTIWTILTPLLQLDTNQLISSDGIDDNTGIPNFKTVSIGSGLKLENSILSLDIIDGSTIKYGTSSEEVTE